MSTPVVSFSELSENAERVAETVQRAQRVRVTRRDGEDLYLATERHDRHREETVDVTVHLVTALVSRDEGARAVLPSLPQVFPWVRHLLVAEVRAFAVDLIDAIRGTAERDARSGPRQVLVEWRATARILADPELTALTATPLPDEDHGEVPAP